MASREIELDVAGRSVTVPRDVVSSVAAAAAARAGVSSRHRDLSLLLGRALSSGKVSLSRSEARALDAVLEESGLTLPQQDGAGRGADARRD
ncbi:MAG TPA: hypothetical protein VFA37_06085 [Gaiellaceae bacterium]|nr:hypothetical protein [Gaiellaceae bacterium]